MDDFFKTVVEFVTAEWWMSRNRCGFFPLWLMWLLVFFHTWIFASYLRISRALASMRREGVSPLPARTSRLFEAFIWLCGCGHFLTGALPFLWPNYIVYAIWHSATSLVSHTAANHIVFYASLSIEDHLTATTNAKPPAYDELHQRLLDRREELADIRRRLFVLP